SIEISAICDGRLAGKDDPAGELNPGPTSCQLVAGLSVKPNASPAETTTSWQLVGPLAHRPAFASRIKDACAPRRCWSCLYHSTTPISTLLMMIVRSPMIVLSGKSDCCTRLLKPTWLLLPMRERKKTDWAPSVKLSPVMVVLLKSVG